MNNTIEVEEMLHDNEIKVFYERLFPEVRIKTRDAYLKKFNYKIDNFYKRLNKKLFTEVEIEFIKNYAEKETEKLRS